MNPTYALWFIALAALWCQLLFVFHLRRVEFRRVARGGLIGTSTLRMWRNLFLLATAATVISVVGGLRIPFDVAPLIPGATVVLVVSPGLLWIVIFRARRVQRLLCPQCLSTGSLVPIKPPPKGMWECLAEDEIPCDLKLWDRYRRMTKVGFPTLGIPASGRTHWLATVYRQISLGNYPSKANITPIDSTTDYFDYLLGGIHGHRSAVTQSGRVPSPPLFEFQDADLWGRTEAMVHIFNLSDWTTQKHISNPRVVRALQTHGFLFFLDPTDEAGVQTQMKALHRFRDGVANVIGPRLKIPVALCVSKIDLLPNQQFGKGGSIDQFYEDIRKVGLTFSLEAMEKRSRIVSRLRETMWPGWEIEKEISRIFGGRHLFFPLTPVGLENIGEKDLKKVTTRPFAIQEPLFWLLHMSGYPVF
jgi:hypothetical protein